MAKLRRLADCLENGKQFTIQIAGEKIRLPANAIFNIEQEREGNNEEVEFQFKLDDDLTLSTLDVGNIDYGF